jgi:hypothetical protein
MLGQLINYTGIAETMVKKAAELGGDRPFILGLVLTLVIALLFSVLGGLGAVIMVATIVLPVMLSIGLPRLIAGSLFLMGLSLGGILNLTNWQLYMSVLGLSQSQILRFALPLSGVMFLVTIIFLAVELKRGGRIYTWAEIPPIKTPVRWYALFTPIIPIVLVFGFSLYNLLAKPAQPFEFPIITAMMIGLVYGVLTTLRKDSVNLITKSIIEGISSVSAAVALIIGIGIILNAVTHPMVSNIISPLITNIMPRSALSYVIFFVVLAPLSLYRGPLNIWGMGAGLVGLMLATRSIPATAIMAALLSVGQIQGVCDPTNTYNVWIANFLKLDVQDILRRTILYVWLAALMGLILAGVWFF